MSDADNLGYSGAADAYWSLGWKPLPMPPRSKKWPPSIKCADARAKRPCQPGCGCVHYTGYQAVEPSYADVTAWAEVFRDGNLALRMPDGVIGVDVDAYDAKTGAAALVEAVKRWGPLPRGPRSSSREGDLTSGIRLFRVPPGTRLETVIAFPDLGIGDIEIIQPHHRYAMVWPSIHPEGRICHWRDENDQIINIPAVDSLPKLPPCWIDGLRVQPRTELSDDQLLYDVRTTMTPGDPSAMVGERLRCAIKELNLAGTSRHDACCRHVLALARLGKCGELGVERAMRILCDVLIALRQADGSDTAEGTRAEFIRMLTNEGIARELSKPGVTDWMASLVVEGIAQQPLNDPGPSSVGVDEGPETDADATGGSASPEPSRRRSPLEDIERGFWDSRESLQRIYQTALAMMASPWAVLGMCSARALTNVRPHVTLPPLIGGPGSLNWFVALVAFSSGGKGAAGQASRLLVPLPVEQIKNAGSGEGIVAAFGRPQDDEDTQPINEALMFDVTESDTLQALNGRSASTTLTIFRAAFSGETLGFSYAAKEKRRHILAHTYRMTMTVGVQPLRAGWLLGDAAGGTPQRFMWFPAEDSRISMDELWPSTPLTLPDRSEWVYPREIVIPPEARFTIRSQRVKAMQGDQDALDGHALFCREKFAYALAVLDGRVQMSLEDWQLSGVAADISTYCRQRIIEAVEEAARIDAIERGALRGIEMEAADVEKVQQQIQRGQRVLNWLLHKLESAGEDGLTQSDLMRMIASRDRRTLSDLLGAGHEAIRAQLLDGNLVWHRK